MIPSTRDQGAKLNRTILASTISALLAGGGVAHAQQQAPQAQQGQQGSQGIEEVLVTGSRIARRDFQAPSPIVTVDAQRLENSSTMAIESVMNQLPQFTPADTQFSQGIQAGPTTLLGIGSLNLRGIGPNRTLVLIDGRRAQPANSALVVDTNTIPSAAIERVETITGGASAVYGADAMAGVVNFILKKNYEGVNMDVRSGMSPNGDGRETRFTGLIGVNSGDGKSNAMLGVEWYDRGAVQLKDRDFFLNGWFDPGTQAGGFIQMPGYSPSTAILGSGSAVPSGGLPTQAAVDSIFASNPNYVGGGVAPAGGLTGGQFIATPRNEIYFNPDGTPFLLAGAANYDGPMDSPSSQTAPGAGYSGVRLQPNGDLGQVSYAGYASSPMTRRSLFGRATHDISDNLTVSVQANYSTDQVSTTGGYPPAITVWSAPIPVDGRAIPPALQTLLDSRPDPTKPWTLFRVLDFLGGPETTTNTNNVYQIQAGFDGKFSHRDWTWSAYVSSGKTDTENYFDELPSLQRYQFLLAQPSATWGRGIFTQGRNYVQTCTSGLPIFTDSSSLGAGQVSPDCLEAIASKARSVQELKQDIAEFNLQGKITDMKAGELRFALGADTRKNSFSFRPAETNDRESVVDNPIGIFASNNTAGQTKVSELYGELLVPVTHKFDVELGLRGSDYADSAIGTTQTSKALFTFRPTDTVSLRGGWQVAERAPNTAELFQGVGLVVVPFSVSDPCDYTTTASWGNQPGNPNRAAVQALCAAIINNSDADPSNDNTSAWAQAPDTYARPGLPFFPLEIELRQGNPDVKPEKGNTFTFGVVLQSPGNLKGLTASFDYYDIKITDAIAPLNSLFAYQQCFNADGTSNPTLSYTGSPYCKYILRNVISGERSSVDAPFINTGSLKTNGLDVAVNWTKDLARGSFSINSQMTFLGKFDVQDAPGSPIVHEKDTLQTQDGGQFKYKMTNTFGYNFGGGKANIQLRWRYLPGIRDESAARNPTTNVYPVASYQNFSLLAGYNINEKMRLRMGIDNLTDVQPNVVGARPGNNNAANTNAGYYDILGRRAYVGLNFEF